MKTVLITGSTDGIGQKTALRLAEAGYFTIIHGRDKKRVDQTVEDVKKISRGRSQVDSCVFNLDSLSEVKACVEDLKNRFPQIDVLLNNAGTYQVERRLSPDGFELTMAVNHLGPTLLTLLLKPLLLKAPKPRVIFVSSIAHNRGSVDSRDYNFEKSFNSYEAYAASKLANIITTRRLASEWLEDGIPVYALHPGVITTKLLRIGFNTDGDHRRARCKTIG
jgi:NAD(P)-dependent dehydrogenase (short-subunit alcohol dehydrogenase family)